MLDCIPLSWYFLTGPGCWEGMKKNVKAFKVQDTSVEKFPIEKTKG